MEPRSASGRRYTNNRLLFSPLGWRNLHLAVERAMGPAGFDPFANPGYGWSFILFQIFLWLSLDTCWQTTAMQTFSVRGAKTSRRVFLWTGFVFLGRGMLPMI
ncbi:MAG: hypothetical protein HXY18_14420 [Bryobacteraceae bacterium]|nr:hypothetical protein [Bryobacteraceae bacterium]